jgi:hypothetical protein
MKAHANTTHDNSWRLTGSEWGIKKILSFQQVLVVKLCQPILFFLTKTLILKPNFFHIQQHTFFFFKRSYLFTTRSSTCGFPIVRGNNLCEHAACLSSD